jgi:hypothetical protein
MEADLRCLAVTPGAAEPGGGCATCAFQDVQHVGAGSPANRLTAFSNPSRLTARCGQAPEHGQGATLADPPAHAP